MKAPPNNSGKLAGIQGDVKSLDVISDVIIATKDDVADIVVWASVPEFLRHASTGLLTMPATIFFLLECETSYATRGLIFSHRISFHRSKHNAISA